MKEIRNRLKNMLSWSDRIGSDEIYEIKEILKLIDKKKYKNTKINTIL